MQISRVDEQVRDMPVMNLPDSTYRWLVVKVCFWVISSRWIRPRRATSFPIVVIRPIYPRDAAISGIEGWVKIEFTITEAGTVKDPQVVDAKPARVFNRAAIRAILKWKFKPRVVEGVAVDRRASQTIDFTLDDAGG